MGELWLKGISALARFPFLIMTQLVAFLLQVAALLLVNSVSSQSQFDVSSKWWKKHFGSLSDRKCFLFRYGVAFHALTIACSIHVPETRKTWERQFEDCRRKQSRIRVQSHLHASGPKRAFVRLWRMDRIHPGM